jgi:hypothetical protein
MLEDTNAGQEYEGRFFFIDNTHYPRMPRVQVCKQQRVGRKSETGKRGTAPIMYIPAN